MLGPEQRGRTMKLSHLQPERVMLVTGAAIMTVLGYQIRAPSQRLSTQFCSDISSTWTKNSTSA